MPNKARRDREKRARAFKAELARTAAAGLSSAAVQSQAQMPQTTVGVERLENLELTRNGQGGNAQSVASVVEIARRFAQNRRGRGETSQDDGFIFRRNDCHAFAKAARDRQPFDRAKLPAIVGTLLRTLDQGHPGRQGPAANALCALVEGGYLDPVTS